MFIDDSIPYFELVGTDDVVYSPQDWDKKRVLVIIFTCNHCPYAQAYEDRIKKLQAFFSVQGVQFVAINSNDATTYPEDSFDNMKKCYKEKKFNFPYLYDKSQIVAQKFAAEVTPEAFVFDKNRKLKYKGRIDDNWRNPGGVTDHSLKDAISAVLSGNTPKSGKAALGCSIKWK